MLSEKKEKPKEHLASARLGRECPSVRLEERWRAMGLEPEPTPRVREGMELPSPGVGLEKTNQHKLSPRKSTETWRTPTETRDKMFQGLDTRGETWPFCFFSAYRPASRAHAPHGVACDGRRGVPVEPLEALGAWKPKELRRECERQGEDGGADLSPGLPPPLCWPGILTNMI